MTFEDALIAALVLLFTLTTPILVKRDLLAGGVYCFLFIYTIFAQIGYVHFPALSDHLHAYFGPEIFIHYNVFVSLSFLAFFLVYLLFHQLGKGYQYYVASAGVRYGQAAFVGIVVLHIAAILTFTLLNYDALSYSSVSDQAFIAEQGLAYLSFGIAFKLTVPIALVLYVVYRLNEALPAAPNRYIVLALLATELAVFLFVAARLGNRTDLVALGLGICVFEYTMGGGLRKLTKLSAFLFGLWTFLTYVESTRFGDEVVAKLPYEAILLKDYFPPSHMLLAAMAHEYVVPLEVAASNLSNALFQVGYPYLQFLVGELFVPGLFTRSSSYAFYIFSEGFLAMGRLGFLYNGVVVASGVFLWRKLAATNNTHYNLFMLALVSTQMVNIVRSQSSYFIKDLYMVFVPAMLLLFLATGLRPAFGWLVASNERKLPAS